MKSSPKTTLIALVLTLVCETFSPTSGAATPTNSTPALVPWPQKIQVANSSISLGSQNWIVAHHEKLRPLAEVLAVEISLTTGLKLPVKVGEASPGDIFLALNSALKNEAHTFVVTDRAVIQGGNYGAVALGTTTLLQSIQIRDGKVFLPVMSVEDQPQTEYRGLFVDVARQYHSLSNLRQMVLLCRLYKIRYLHLHLTDDQSVMFPSQA